MYSSSKRGDIIRVGKVSFLRNDCYMRFEQILEKVFEFIDAYLIDAPGEDITLSVVYTYDIVDSVSGVHYYNVYFEFMIRFEAERKDILARLRRNHENEVNFIRTIFSQGGYDDYLYKVKVANAIDRDEQAGDMDINKNILGKLAGRELSNYIDCFEARHPGRSFARSSRGVEQSWK